VSFSMEPKSIAFYTAVAVSILAVLSATTFPALAQAQAGPTDAVQEPSAQENSEAAVEDSQPDEENAELNEETEPEQERDPQKEEEKADLAKDEQGASNDNGESSDTSDRSQTLGLDSSSGVVSCGQIVTEDVTLTSDLNCGSGDGLIVGASGIAINLNGYKITGSDDADSQPSSMDYDGSSGIVVANVDDVVISGLGEISNFDRGVTLMGSSGTQLTDVQLANNGIGVLMSGASGSELSRNTITNNGMAVISDSSNGGVIAFNQIVANLEQGIGLLGSDENVVAANNMFGNGANGIFLDIMSNGNTVDYNTVFGHETADINNADGQPINLNQNSFGGNNNCGTSLPGGLCR
ncbi:MAG: right-handed parallel beta-helix repeat-containing protein, partial [Thermoproteota archaeon]|nr:right-handed parallel beta-helix repeat-containing protein [Thermoproteota archaeon]